MNQPTLHRELAGGGSVGVADGVVDRWQVTCDSQHVTWDTWYDFFGSGAPFLTGQQIQFPPYAEFLTNHLLDLWKSLKKKEIVEKQNLLICMDFFLAFVFQSFLVVLYETYKMHIFLFNILLKGHHITLSIFGSSLTLKLQGVSTSVSEAIH